MAPTRAGTARRSLAVVVLVVAGACTGGAGEPGTSAPGATTASPSTTSVPPPTTTTLPPAGDCEPGGVEPFAVDLDRDGQDEVAFVRDGGTLVVCVGDDVDTVDLEAVGAEIAGFHDLDTDGTAEILFTRPTERGTALGAVAPSLRGWRLTRLALERWSDLDRSSSGPFEGASYQCLDWDDDGALDLIHWQFTPADDEVSVRAGLVALEGGEPVEGGVDRYETGRDAAVAIWEAEDGCGPGESARRPLRYSAQGWAVVALDAALFADRDDVVLVAAAANAGRVVAVGTEAPNPALGTQVEARPLAWWSDDGQTWTKAEVAGSDAAILDVAARDAGFVAVGRAGPDPAVWTSADGTAFELATLATTLPGGQAVIYAVASDPTGALVAVGAESYLPDGIGHTADSDAAVWRSADGRSWERILSPALGTQGYQPNAGAEFNGAILDVAATDDGLIGVGYDSDPDPDIDFPDQFPAVWRSADGTHWERARLDHEARLTGIVHAGGRTVVYGTTGLHGSPTSDAAILLSDDGATWAPAGGELGALQEPDGIQAVNAVRPAPGGGWLALGSDQSEFQSAGAAAVWRSGDLVAWERLPNDTGTFGDIGAPPAPVINDAVLTGDGTMVAVGTRSETVDLVGSGSVCCLYRPQVWLHQAASRPGAG